MFVHHIRSRINPCGLCTAFLIRVLEKTDVLFPMRSGDSDIHRVECYKKAGTDLSERMLVDNVLDKD